LLVIPVVLIVACSQKGKLTVENDTGGVLEVTVDEQDLILTDGESGTREVDIGVKFIFGPDDTDISVEGLGDCKLPFKHMVNVAKDETKRVVVTGDAGMVRVCNQTLEDLPLYLVTCNEASWGAPVTIVRFDDCTSWLVEAGCWSLKLGDFVEPYTVEDIDIAICDVFRITFPEAKVERGDAEIARDPGAARLFEPLRVRPDGFRRRSD
jgi:hypothetical protein